MTTSSPRIEPCGYRATAWLGETEVASSSAALRVDEPGAAPTLYFPVDDVHFERLSSAGDGPVVRVVDHLAGPLAPLSGKAVFDGERVRLELLDTVDGEDPRAATVKRFPNWGDARHLLELFELRPAGFRRYTSAGRHDHRRPVVEGSQMLGQAIVAACREVPARRPVFAAMVFLRAADAAAPLCFELDELSEGRTFAGLSAQVVQHDRRCAAGTILLDRTADDVVRHHAPPPEVPGPFDCPPLDMGVTGRDIRVVDGAYDDDPGAPVGPPEIAAWVRFREVPDDPALHAGLLAQFTGHMSIAAALRPHAGFGQQQAHRTLSTAVNAISFSLHRDARVDRWVLYRHRSTFAGDGMTHSECRVNDEAGDLVASFTVDCMVRGFRAPHGPIDARTTL